MNDVQIENWRCVLAGQIGSYAFLMPREDIITLRDRLQAQFEAVEQPRVLDVFCTCDQKYHGFTKHMDDSVTCNNCGKIRQ